MPPVAVTPALPVPPLHNIPCITAAVHVSADGCVIVTLAVFVQPLLSVTVTVYVPAARPVAVAVVALFDHKYV